MSGSSAYWPICIMAVAGKLLERMLRPRLNVTVREASDLSHGQFGFRLGRSTIDAIRMVTDTVTATQCGNRHSWRVVLMVTLDVRNAFNSTSWKWILETLERKCRVPIYLLHMLDAYFRDCVLQYVTRQGVRGRSVSAGVAHGSIFGPDL